MVFYVSRTHTHTHGHTHTDTCSFRLPGNRVASNTALHRWSGQLPSVLWLGAGRVGRHLPVQEAARLAGRLCSRLSIVFRNGAGANVLPISFVDVPGITQVIAPIYTRRTARLFLPVLFFSMIQGHAQLRWLPCAALAWRCQAGARTRARPLVGKTVEIPEVDVDWKRCWGGLGASKNWTRPFVWKAKGNPKLHNLR